MKINEYIDARRKFLGLTLRVTMKAFCKKAHNNRIFRMF